MAILPTKGTNEMSRKTIKLAYHAMAKEFTVVQVCNSLEFNPGQILKPAEVQRLCDSTTWHVTTVESK